MTYPRRDLPYTELLLLALFLLGLAWFVAWLYLNRVALGFDVG